MSDFKIITHSTYKNYEYLIVLFNNSWYCAYIVIPESHPLYQVHYDNIQNINVHGGFKFSDFHQLLDNKWALGWDYMHLGDYNPILGEDQCDILGMPNHKWKPKEIENECKNVIDQLNTNYTF